MLFDDAFIQDINTRKLQEKEDNIMEVIFKPDEDNQTQNISWKVTKAKDNQIDIQLDFD